MKYSIETQPQPLESDSSLPLLTNLLQEFDSHLLNCSKFIASSSSSIKDPDIPPPKNFFSNLDLQIKQLDQAGSNLFHLIQSLLTSCFQNSSINSNVSLQSNDPNYDHLSVQEELSERSLFNQSQAKLDSWFGLQSQLFDLRKEANAFQLKQEFLSYISSLAKQFDSLLIETQHLLVQVSTDLSTKLVSKNNPLLNNSAAENPSPNVDPIANINSTSKGLKAKFRKICKVHSLLTPKKSLVLKRINLLETKTQSYNLPVQSTNQQNNASSNSEFLAKFQELNSIDEKIISVLKNIKSHLSLFKVKANFAESLQRIYNLSHIITARLSELLHFHFLQAKISNPNSPTLMPKKNNTPPSLKNSHLTNSSQTIKDSYIAYTKMAIKLKVTSADVNTILNSLLDVITSFKNKPIFSNMSESYANCNSYWEKIYNNTQDELKMISSYFELHYNDSSKAFNANNHQSSDIFSNQDPFNNFQTDTFDVLGPLHSIDKQHSKSDLKRRNSVISNYSSANQSRLVKKYSNCLILQQQLNLDYHTSIKSHRSSFDSNIKYKKSSDSERSVSSSSSFSHQNTSLESLPNSNSSSKLFVFRPFSRIVPSTNLSKNSLQEFNSRLKFSRANTSPANSVHSTLSNSNLDQNSTPTNSNRKAMHRISKIKTPTNLSIPVTGDTTEPSLFSKTDKRRLSDNRDFTSSEISPSNKTNSSRRSSHSSLIGSSGSHLKTSATPSAVSQLPSMSNIKKPSSSRISTPSPLPQHPIKMNNESKGNRNSMLKSPTKLNSSQLFSSNLPSSSRLV
ncbi:hypothetical protein BB560_005397 [Smittium megazygosporum]|uniref:Karyogamy protein n=1 Tax=Smittium megazygosporum TaxID=133381 RepID=A0A2T9Z6G8_9FUNG|nr:hypothetical protein BB560_005397 [Smittium megazygosporum]